jgi:hypothetical protein
MCVHPLTDSKFKETERRNKKQITIAKKLYKDCFTYQILQWELKNKRLKVQVVLAKFETEKLLWELDRSIFLIMFSNNNIGHDLISDKLSTYCNLSYMRYPNARAEVSLQRSNLLEYFTAPLGSGIYN